MVVLGVDWLCLLVIMVSDLVVFSRDMVSEWWEMIGGGRNYGFGCVYECNYGEIYCCLIFYVWVGIGVN